MPVNIRNVGPSNLPPDQPAPTSSQSSGPAAPSPQDLQANINQGIQQAAQNLDQIIAGVTGNTAVAKLDAAASGPTAPPATQPSVAEAQGGGITGLLEGLKSRAEHQQLLDKIREMGS